MAVDNVRISKTAVTSSGRIAMYTNSPTDLDPSLIDYIAGNSLSPIYLSTLDTDAEDVSLDDLVIVDESESKDLEEEEEESSTKTKFPSLGDISIVSNTVVYDSAGKPSVTLVIKIKNSSGEILKGMNARLELVW